MGNTGDFIGTTEAAALLQMTGRRVVGLCSEGKLAGAFKAGRNWKIPMESVKKYRKDAGITLTEEASDEAHELLPFAIGNTSFIEISSEC